MQMANGTMVKRDCGTPQGGVISPLLSNLFLHYVYDVWMSTYHRSKPWCRYADDGLAHCKTEAEAKKLQLELRERLAECKLELYPDKTKIIYCKDGKRKGEYPDTKFKFLGYEFRRRMVMGMKETMFLSFTPAISKEAKKAISKTIRRTGVRGRSELSIEEIARWLNPMIDGWINYYGKYNQSAMKPVMRQINHTLIKWCMNKYKSFRYSKPRAIQFMVEMSKNRFLLVRALEKEIGRLICLMEAV